VLPWNTNWVHAPATPSASLTGSPALAFTCSASFTRLCHFLKQSPTKKI
jgi:hypothetical protein